MIAVQLIVLIVLLCLSAFFSSAETALTTVNKIHIRTLANEGNKQAKTVLKITENSGKMLSAILIGNNVVNLSASSLATILATKLFGSSGAGIATGILTLLILIFGEISPKTMASLRAERISLKYSSVIWCIMVVLTPVIFVVNKLSMGVLRIVGVDPSEGRRVMTEKEIRTIVAVGHESGVIEAEEKEMINNMFDLGDTKVKDIMTPRVDMCAVAADITYHELIAVIKKEKFTRIPVFDDNPDKIMGIMNVKDIIFNELVGDESFSIRGLLREPYFTHENKNTADLLIEMRKASISMAIVLDEYGMTSGLISLEDLLEEIVGEIRDEYDGDEEGLVIPIGEKEFIIEGSMNLEDFSDRFGYELQSEDYDSVGGYIIGLLDRIPRLRESVTDENGIFFRVVKKDKNRIVKVSVRLPADS